MNRNKIRLYNTEKYQAVLPAPEIEELEGDAQEVIISADGREESASGEVISSVTFNASGGVWYDTGAKTNYIVTESVQSSQITRIAKLPVDVYRSASLTICLEHNNSVRMDNVTMVNDGGTQVEVDHVPRSSLGQDLTAVNYLANVSNNNVNITCECPIGTQHTVIVNGFVR